MDCKNKKPPGKQLNNKKPCGKTYNNKPITKAPVAKPITNLKIANPNSTTLEERKIINKMNNKIKNKIIDKIKNNLINLIDRKINIYIFGCSHTKCFIRDSINIYNINIYNKFISGASLLGFTRTESKLDYQNIINNYITNDNTNYYLFKFGQVDIEYVYYYKLYILKQEIKMEEYCIDLINKYIRLLLKYKTINNNIIVCGLNLCNFKSYILNLNNHLNMKIEVNENDVNSNLLLFNKILQKECEQNNIIYFDLIKETTEINKGIIRIKNEFIGYDYHYKGAESKTTYIQYLDKNDSNTHFVFLNKLFKFIK